MIPNVVRLVILLSLRNASFAEFNNLWRIETSELLISEYIIWKFNS